MGSPYEFSIDAIRTSLSQRILPTQRSEETLCRMVHELQVRLARSELDANNSLWVDRLADQAEAALAALQRELAEYRQRHGYVPQDEAELTAGGKGW